MNVVKTSPLCIALAQMNAKVGDVMGNTRKILDLAHRAHAQGADIIVFPELALTGYSPEDLLWRPELRDDVAQAIVRLKQAAASIAIVVGFPDYKQNRLYNAAAFFYQEQQTIYHKQHLPNYAVFDEKRYFSEGTQSCVVSFKGRKIGLLICEDIWFSEPACETVHAGAEIILSLNASPYRVGQPSSRARNLNARAVETGVPVVYVNLVGGQDELVFDGRSMVFDGTGKLIHQSAAFFETLDLITWQDKTWQTVSEQNIQPKTEEEEIYQALVLGVRDYVEKNNFPGVVIGLSGGIDSALTLAIAVDALGSSKVRALSMPSQYTASMSIEDAQQQAQLMKVHFDIVSIIPMFESFMAALQPLWKDAAVDSTEENIQARCRGVLLMAVSNKTGYMVLTTGNKSEMAVGYATLYGDMAGGFDVLKDVPKTMVYRLAHYRNQISAVIPQRVVERPPTAELAPEQRDDDTLPSYDVLDAILKDYVEEDRSVADIVAKGFPKDVVADVAKRVIHSEYKRRQAPPGIRISKRAFGRDRRYPITRGSDL